MQRGNLVNNVHCDPGPTKWVQEEEKIIGTPTKKVDAIKHAGNVNVGKSQTCAI